MVIVSVVVSGVVAAVAAGVASSSSMSSNRYARFAVQLKIISSVKLLTRQCLASAPVLMYYVSLRRMSGQDAVDGTAMRKTIQQSPCQSEAASCGDPC